uniref:Low-density lipoprotein receptor-related protein 2-like n=1 Tax=Sinocyclocheilus rhinocerous TaxID=307959 RepID=A0A673KVB5_9TELE
EDDCQVNNGGCSHGCIQGPFGAQCTCEPGFQLLNDSKTCDDINECLIPGFCSQTCYNERGSFRCYCQDGYHDEIGCVYRTCSSQEFTCQNGVCIPSTYNCVDTQTGYYCSCRDGYKLMPDGKACEDIDECKEEPGVCSQVCENAVGSFYCKCAPGYLREPDGRTCRQNMWPHALTIDYTNNKIFFADAHLNFLE